ncbi:uncharacterized protein F4812DRAFT_83103 [Daldinia caldariorum]|uniref:uncharacterized protein n=1 Tax=Daldinia caldariorum TaxID=326644 RepID=UPI002008C2F0|nr:uncharacterized protein F4812DRAFT_83103 [Daldinia caldariorum]KAI1466550.1 hypothetical protein F4812DRAFT_83103 [Daldinia caldariorum]
MLEIAQHSLSSQEALWFLLLATVLLALTRFMKSFSRGPKTTANQPNEKAPKDDEIEPLWDFDFRKADPIKYQPYKTQGHVTMGIQKRVRSDWIRMDRGYLARIEERLPLIRNKPEFTIGTGEAVNPAIEELYEEIMIRYLPARFPTMFETQGGMLVKNLATGTTYPLTTKGLTHAQMLAYMGENVEEDFYFMCPDPNGDFRLQGYIACFPGGFLSPARVGESVREIHRPVPGYERKLGLSVDRYFARMKPGDFIGRMNWSLQVDGADLFRTDGNNYYPGTEQVVSGDKGDPSLDECYLRVEHQTLTKLARTSAVIFTVRSYMTPLRQVRAEGDGRALAEAIESMPEGLGHYKMVQYWGRKVLPWLMEDV